MTARDLLEADLAAARAFQLRLAERIFAAHSVLARAAEPRGPTIPERLNPDHYLKGTTHAVPGR